MTMGENSSEEPQNSGRRRLIKATAAGVVGIGAAKIIKTELDNHKVNNSHVNSAQSGNQTENLPNTTVDSVSRIPQESFPKDYVPSVDAVRLGNEMIEKDALNEILALPPFTDKDETVYNPARLKLERKYVDLASSLESINRGFLVIGNPELRMQLLRARYSIRCSQQMNTESFRELKPEFEKWAIEHKIHPEVLATCIDQYSQAVKLMQPLKNDIRPDLKAHYDPEDILLNAGAIAELICEETGLADSHGLRYGYANIGTKTAYSQINPNVFKEDRDDLQIISNRLYDKLGLKYDPKTIIGSTRGDASINVSGGAIGLQFMPENAKMIDDLFRKSNDNFIPWDIESSTKGVYLFLAMRSYFHKNLLFSDALYKTIQSWNHYIPEDDAVNKAYLEYKSDFPSSPTSGRIS